jgi:S-formylglutathione hydrolase FrmB
MIPMKYLSGAFFLFTCLQQQAATVDTVSVYSPSMQKKHSCVVIKPGSYRKKQNRFPVVYLLHGYSGNYADWVKKVPAIKALADAQQVMIVCPDGNYSSWYYDSPVDSNWKYETHITAEVVPYIDRQYRTLPQPEKRAITGLSMGGHGALYLGLRHRNLFGACGSMSGGVDVNASRKQFDIALRIGDTINHAANWQGYSVLYLVEQYKDTRQPILFDCGTKDFYLQANRALHQKLLQLGLAHDYIERPGAHNWAYWANAIQYQLLYFGLFFRQEAS